MHENKNIIGVLTSGGDAPGMNAAIRSVTRAAITKGYRVMGIYEGYKGLVIPNLKLLSSRDVSNVIDKGGTFLHSDRCAEFNTEAGLEKAKQTCIENNIVGIVAIGGDGTFRGATDFTQKGIPCVGIPATIDNDITSTDYSIGFDTAMNTVLEMVDRLRETCESHARCTVVEVMGRAAGYIALEAGIAVGASAIAVKEIPFDEDEMLKKLVRERADNKRNFTIMLAEGIPLDKKGDRQYGEKLAERITNETNIEARFTRLGHVVRGGSPTLRDRLLASRMGVEAVELLHAGRSNRVVCVNDDKIDSMDIQYALTLDRMYKTLIDPEYEKKLTPAELESFSSSQISEMREFCDRKFGAFKEMYQTANLLAK